MKEFLLFVGFLVLWIALNRWILPWFGVPTCMSGGCAVRNAPSCCADPVPQDRKDVSEEGEPK